MIYLQNKTESQPLAVPKPCATPGGDIVFKARSTVDLNVVMDIQVLDIRISDQYFFLAVSVPANAPNGEYQYTIKVDGEVVAGGLLMLCQAGEGFTIIGEDEFSTEEYNKNIRYEQYET